MHTITHACLNRRRLQAEPIFTYEEERQREHRRISPLEHLVYNNSLG